MGKASVPYGGGSTGDPKTLVRAKVEEEGNISGFLPTRAFSETTGDLLECHRNGAADLQSTTASCKNRVRATFLPGSLEIMWEEGQSSMTLCSSSVEIPTDQGGPWQTVSTKKESSGTTSIHITM